MTDAVLNLALPAVEIGGGLLISSRINWRNHPALIAYLATEAACQIAYAIVGYSLKVWIVPVQVLTRTAVTFEVMEYSRVPISPEARGRIVGAAMIVCAALAAMHGGTAWNCAFLFRQYYLLGLCGALAGLIAVRVWRPVLECARHKVTRAGVAAWLTVIAASATFTPGGIGGVPQTDHDWRILNWATYGALILTVSWMAAKIYMSVRPRKVAARAMAVKQQGRERVAA